MARALHRSRFHRQHGAVQPVDRCALEAAGWRTTLEYRENHVRDRGGRLTHLQVVWYAEAERETPDGVEAPVVVAVAASSVEKVWSRLRTQAEVADVSAQRRERARATVV